MLFRKHNTYTTPFAFVQGMLPDLLIGYLYNKRFLNKRNSEQVNFDGDTRRSIMAHTLTLNTVFPIMLLHFVLNHFSALCSFDIILLLDNSEFFSLA